MLLVPRFPTYVQGVLCGDCLFMRYGENVDEANANPGEVSGTSRMCLACIFQLRLKPCMPHWHWVRL